MWIYCCLSVPSVRYVPTAALLANIVYLVIYEQDSSSLNLDAVGLLAAKKKMHIEITECKNASLSYE